MADWAGSPGSQWAGPASCLPVPVSPGNTTLVLHLHLGASFALPVAVSRPARPCPEPPSGSALSPFQFYHLHTCDLPLHCHSRPFSSPHRNLNLKQQEIERFSTILAHRPPFPERITNPRQQHIVLSPVENTYYVPKAKASLSIPPHCSCSLPVSLCSQPLLAHQQT